MTPNVKDHVDAKRYAHQLMKEYVSDTYKKFGDQCKYSTCILHEHRGLRCNVERNHCDKIEVDVDEEEENGLLDMHGAGLVCKGVTRMGNQLGDADASAPATFHWVANQARRRTKVIVTECGVDMDTDVISNGLPDECNNYSCVLNATNVGDCICRERRVSTHLDQCEVAFNSIS